MFESPERYGSKYNALLRVSGLLSNCLPPTFKETIAAARRSRGEAERTRFMMKMAAVQTCLSTSYNNNKRFDGSIVIKAS